MGQNPGQLKKKIANRLQVFEMACLRRIMGVTRLDKIRNTHIKESLNLDQDVMDKVSTKRLKYFGHVPKNDTYKIPQKLPWKERSQEIDPGEAVHPKDDLTASQRTAKQDPYQGWTDASRLAADRKNLAYHHHTEAITRPQACVDGISQVSQVNWEKG